MRVPRRNHSSAELISEKWFLTERKEYTIHQVRHRKEEEGSNDQEANGPVQLPSV